MSDEQFIPERSADARAALDVFYIDFNEVNFYFEDQDQENLYAEIVRKIFPEIRVARIFPLNGKHSLLSHAQSSSVIPSKRRVYIVDRDFDHFLGREIDHPSIFYLDYFCIENHLLEPEALVELVIENSPKFSRDEVRSSLGLEAKINEVANKLRRLFALFMIAQRYGSRLTNTSEKVEKFCVSGNPSTLCADQIENYRSQLHEDLYSLLIPLGEKFPEDDPFYEKCQHIEINRLVSGKHVLKIIFHTIKKAFPMGSITFESFCYRAVKNCELKTLGNLQAAVKHYLEAAE